MSFLPNNFSIPSASGKYLKLKDGDNIRLRILSDAISFWQYWDSSNHPIRIKYDGGWAITPKEADPKKKSSFCIAMVIWNYNTEQVQIWSPSQKGVIRTLDAWTKDPDIGDPKGYDIKLGRTGSDMTTEYTINALMKPDNTKPMDKKILDEAKDVNLEALFTGEDPFAKNGTLETPF